MKTLKKTLCICVVLVLMILSACSSPAQGDDGTTDLTESIFANVKEGDTITFGKYEQDNDSSNGKEDIEWLVLDVKDDRALVISKYALDCKPYNTKLNEVTWETSTIRSWLNDDFINRAFSDEEKAMIPTITVTADEKPDNSTQDQVFLLSVSEA